MAKALLRPRLVKWYGWRPDLPDVRDRKLAITAPPALPDHVDLRDQCPPVYDQGQLGSCTANAIAAALEFDQKKQGLKEFTPARLYIYYNERVIEGTVGQDAGAQIRDGIKSVNKVGAPPENEWPYKISIFTRKPSPKAYRDGKKHPAVQYASVAQTLPQLQGALAQGLPFVFGFSVYESFESNEVSNTGEVPLPGVDEQLLGGHAVLAVGYDNASSRFIVRNSWGTDWGLKGYFTMPYDYLTNNDLADDFWTIQSTK